LLLRCCLAALALLPLAAPGSAANTVKVTGVSVGLPTGARPVDRDDAGVSKFAAWTPVYVSLEVMGEVTEPAELLIETPDADEINTTLAIPIDLTGIAAGTKVYAPDRGAIGYVRPASAQTEVTVTVRAKSGAPISEPRRVRLRPREPLQYVVLALGGAPAGFELPKPATGGDTAGTLRFGRVELAHINTFADLPDQWFGYEGADLVLLNTGTATDEFLKQLFSEPAGARKRDALIEWVRRGGRLVISVGEKAKLVAQFEQLQNLLPYRLKPGEPSRTVGAVSLFWSAGQASQTNVLSGSLGDNSAPFAIANLVPREGNPANVVIPPAGRQEAGREILAAQSAFGLGRVTVIGFDLDGPAFAKFSRRADFWDWVLRECGANRASAGGEGKTRPPGVLTEDEDEANAAIRLHNDTFEGVPVVSFGWVAMLIALYLVLIGPLEYYFLKRILGRLELTWVTFPIIALTVSGLAYFSADAVKGRELRVNKVDVVDVDPESDRIYGTTWFTVFSPKIDTYSVTAEPDSRWADSHTRSETVSWLGAPRGGRPGLVRRKYEIRTEESSVADGLENVPIQVWSTKAFSANWSGAIRGATDSWPGRPRARVWPHLTHPPGDRTKVVGTFLHGLPVPVLTDCVAFYAGQAYPLAGEVIVRGQPVRLVLDQGTPAVQWLQANGKADALLSRVQSYAERPGQKVSQKQQPQALTGPLPMWGVLFHEATLKNEEGVYARNASLRRLDQTWRLSPENRDEVIVVGRTAPQYGPAEEVLTGPNAPSKLWLKGLPGSGERQKIPGTARQETWVRFYLPVK
jgi:hypothetical protein